MIANSLAGGLFGFMLAAVATPVGVSGAVFLLPLQLSVLGVPSPSITPTNLLFNVVSVPGALWRYRHGHRLNSHLSRQLLIGTVPGVIVGAVARVYLLPGGNVFRALLAVFLLPLGAWLVLGSPRQISSEGPELRLRAVSLLAFGTGFLGGVYGIGGGSLLSPVLVAGGYVLADVAPAALLSTWVTSCVGAATYAVLNVGGHPQAAPHWALGVSCGIGGLIGGYVGAGLQSRLPHELLRKVLGLVAIGLAVLYLAAVARG